MINITSIFIFVLGYVFGSISKKQFYEYRDRRKNKEIEQLKGEIKRIDSQSIYIGNIEVSVSPDGGIKAAGKNWEMPKKIN